MAFVMFAALSANMRAGSIVNNGEYYIWLNIYEKLIGTNEAGDGPALSAYGVNTDGYVFVAESSGKSGYWLLRQKSSGKYLAAGSNGYSVILADSKKTDDEYCWQLETGTYVTIVNKKKTGNCLGIDGAKKGSTYVGFYYDKSRGSHSQFSVIPASGSSWDDARQAYDSGVYTNAQGVQELDYCQVNNQKLSYSLDMDIHITANDTPILGSTTINLGSDKTWLIFDNILPSDVQASYLQYVTINGKKASVGSNCRVAIYLNGAAVIPTPSPIMSCSGTSGSFTLGVGSNSDLGSKNNTMTSFVLRRGYMATVASGTNGSGYSRVYVADHADLNITLPEPLAKRVSSVYVKEWQYVSKKGWADTAGRSKGPQLRATWYWSWNAGYSSSTDMEYVPCRQHRWWPSASEVNSHTATASLSLNEPEHSEQHNNCSCGGTTDAWTAYGFNKEFQAGGGRIGSPQPTDFSWLTQYFKYIDENNNQSRCDFAVTHAYWDIGSRSASDYASYMVNQCQTICNNTGRPVWLTEMEIGASWFTNTEKRISSYDAARQYLQTLLDKLEDADCVERYAIYSFDYWRNKMFYDDGGITPAGQVYRDHRSTFAYKASMQKIPSWWRPGIQTPTLTASCNVASNTITFTVGNKNGDCTELLDIQQQVGSSWQTVKTITDRSLFDDQSVECSYTVANADQLQGVYRVVCTTLFGGSATSSEVKTGYISNPGIVTSSSDNVPGWTCERSASNGYTKESSGDTYFEVWSPTAATMDFNYYQDIEGLPAGVYRLSAACFNSSNGESGASVNGHVGLYAVADGIGYFAPVYTDSELDYNNRTVINAIVVRGGSLRVGIRNIGQMTARWAGADDFELEYIGTEADALGTGYEAFVAQAEQSVIDCFTDLADGRNKDATGLLGNPDCARGTKDRWTVSNLGVQSGQAWDGNNENKYFDQWNSGSLSSSMSQTLTYLPAGNYVVSALLRGTSGISITLTATKLSAMGNQDYSTSITGAGDQTISGSSYQRGWSKVETEVITIEPGDQLIIGASASASSTAWWSADHFQLTYIPTGDPEPVLYTLTYEVDGEVVKTEQYEEGAEIIPEPEPEKEGYEFSGWSEIPAVMPDHDVTITGSFTEILPPPVYKLTYEVDGEVVKTEEYEEGAEIIPEPEPEKEGYEFSGWSEIPAVMPDHDVVVTGSFTLIDAIRRIGQADSESAVYLLDGRRVNTAAGQPLAPGIYIIDRRKVVVK